VSTTYRITRGKVAEKQLRHPPAPVEFHVDYPSGRFPVPCFILRMKSDRKEYSLPFPFEPDDATLPATHARGPFEYLHVFLEPAGPSFERFGNNEVELMLHVLCKAYGFAVQDDEGLVGVDEVGIQYGWPVGR
jgi:hypothetical protein